MPTKKMSDVVRKDRETSAALANLFITVHDKDGKLVFDPKAMPGHDEVVREIVRDSGLDLVSPKIKGTEEEPPKPSK